MKDYPTEEELKRIELFDLSKEGVDNFIDFLESIIWNPDWCFKLSGKRVLRIQFHTGGWSGNESIINSLQKNFIFWSMCWRRHDVGGHYWFEIKRKLFNTVKQKY